MPHPPQFHERPPRAYDRQHAPRGAPSMARELTPLEKLAAQAIKTDQDSRLAARQRATLATLHPPPREEDTPKALVLVTTVHECSCGAVWPAPNTAVLVRYDSRGHTNSVHYRRETLQRFLHLPREH